MGNASQLFEQIDHFEAAGLYAEAQACRQKVLAAAESAEENEFVSHCDFLVHEKIAVRGVEGAAIAEPFYKRLHDVVCQKLGSNHILAALAKRKMAKMAMVQGRYSEAIGWLEQALPVMSAFQGAKSWEVREAKGLLIEWTHYMDPAKATAITKAMEEEARRLFPLCEHLKRVEDYLVALGIKILDPAWRFGPNGEITVHYDAWLDISSLREKFQLDPCVGISEWDDRRGSDGRGFVCTVHQDSIEGYYHRRPDTPIVS
jgi:tetratricopeptide (TPR) repeat protein